MNAQAAAPFGVAVAILKRKEHYPASGLALQASGVNGTPRRTSDVATLLHPGSGTEEYGGHHHRSILRD
jgi:hypothetical protein